MILFAGLVVLESLFRELHRTSRLTKCCGQLRHACGYSAPRMVLVMCLLLGYRRLQEVGVCREDLMVGRECFDAGGFLKC